MGGSMAGWTPQALDMSLAQQYSSAYAAAAYLNARRNGSPDYNEPPALSQGPQLQASRALPAPLRQSSMEPDPPGPSLEERRRIRIENSLIDPNDVPLTPSSMALTPRTRSISAGQLLLARALAFEAMDEIDDTPLSRKSVEVSPSREASKAAEEAAAAAAAAAVLELEAEEEKYEQDEEDEDEDDDDDEGAEFVTFGSVGDADGDGLWPPAPRTPSKDLNADGSPRTVSQTPPSPPTQSLKNSQLALEESPLQRSISDPSGLPPPAETGEPSKSWPMRMSPKSASKLDKQDLQALINARIERSISERKKAATSPTTPSMITPLKPNLAPPLDRFHTRWVSLGRRTCNPFPSLALAWSFPGSWHCSHVLTDAHPLRLLCHSAGSVWQVPHTRWSGNQLPGCRREHATHAQVRGRTKDRGRKLGCL